VAIPFAQSNRDAARAGRSESDAEAERKSEFRQKLLSDLFIFIPDDIAISSRGHCDPSDFAGTTYEVVPAPSFEV